MCDARTKKTVESRRPYLWCRHAPVLDYQARRCVTAFVLTLSLFMVSSPSLVVADQSIPAAVEAHRDGKITGVYETTIQIDHKTFSFIPNVVIVDRHGDPLYERDIRVDLEVKYHLLKGTTDQIDRIILFLPE